MDYVLALAIYGSVLSTAVALFEIYKYFDSKQMLTIFADWVFPISGVGNVSEEKAFIIEIRNTKPNKIVIDHVGFIEPDGSEVIVSLDRKEINGLDSFKYRIRNEFLAGKRYRAAFCKTSNGKFYKQKITL